MTLKTANPGFPHIGKHRELEFPLHAPFTGPVATCLIDIVFPGQTNHHGTLFGGAAFALMDRVAFIAATRHGRVPFVTASCDRLDFKSPVRPGQIIEVVARPLWSGRKALTVEVEMTTENLPGGERHLCTRGLFNMVAVPEKAMPASWSLSSVLPRPAYRAKPGETVMTEIVFADQTNAVGNMFGGEAISAMTKAAFVSATRHCRRPVVAASSHKINFRKAIAVGSIVDLVASVKSTGKSSMATGVELWAEDPLSGRRVLAAEGEFVMVCVDENGKPVAVSHKAPATG